ncbi:hypothetical protein RJT34_28999 [Clitoria ternatea]|uniref:protein-serine/threonine phosphatase n=1 Tax=Clitoria ternatea TaxID=43366 RepID=A0AAN9FIE1_CLITE
MLSWVSRCCSSSFRRFPDISDTDDEGSSSSSNADPLVWRRGLDKHSSGEFSFAVVQANRVIEDYSQVEIGSNAFFVGVYDGHGGPDASQYVSNNLFQNLISRAQDDGNISEETIRSAFAATEDGFMTVVRRGFEIKPMIAGVGSCVLVGVIWKGSLYVANLGDSRAIIGYTTGSSNKINVEQLTSDHNASREEIRRELIAAHPNDPRIIVNRGTWRVKDKIQISRSIGDAFLKRPEFRLDSSYPRFYVPEPITRPVLSAEPSVSSRVLQPTDKFLIFASDGLWENLTNEEAAEIVHRNPRNGIARKLVKASVKEAIKKRGIEYKDLVKIGGGGRREYHDDITVIVVFLDNERVAAQELSYRGGFAEPTGPSNFRDIQELM